MSRPAAPGGLLEIREIVAIDTASRTRSFKLAAEAMNMSQPTLSRLIASAEHSLGYALFRRGWSGADTTPHGDIAARTCKQIVRMIDAVQDELFADQAGVPSLKYNIKTAHLQAIDATCREGSVTFAAAALNKSQPDISRILNDFSKRFHVQIFKRTATGMSGLKPAQVLGALHSRIFHALDSLPDQLRSLGEEFAGRVSIGMLPFSGQDLILRAFAQITNAHPNVRLACVPGSYNALVDALRRGEIDRIVGIGRGAHCPTGLTEEFLYHERYALIARRDHPLIQDPADKDLLARTHWIVAPHGTPVRSYFESVLSEIDVTPTTQTCELLSFGFAEQMLLDSNSVAVLSYSARKLGNLYADLGEIRTDFPRKLAPITLTRTVSARCEPALEEFDRLLRDGTSEQS